MPCASERGRKFDVYVCFPQKCGARGNVHMCGTVLIDMYVCMYVCMYVAKMGGWGAKLDDGSSSGPFPFLVIAIVGLYDLNCATYVPVLLERGCQYAEIVSICLGFYRTFFVVCGLLLQTMTLVVCFLLIQLGADELCRFRYLSRPSWSQGDDGTRMGRLRVRSTYG
jgi:hypothetical protein